MAGTTIADSATRQLAAELATMRVELDAIKASMRAPQLPNSAIDNGSLAVKDAAGTTRAVIGLQPDGTFTTTSVNNPVPPQVPAAPTAAGTKAGVQVSSHGPSSGVWPMDFAGLRVYVAVVGAPGTLAGTITPDPGVLPIAPLPYVTQRVWLTSVNHSGAESAPSPEATATPAMVVGQDVLDGIVTTVKLSDQAVAQAKIATGAVGTGQIQGQAVTLSQLADGSVNAAKLVDGSVGPNAISSGAVTVPKIANGAVTGPAIAGSAVTTGSIAAGAVTANSIATNSITSGQIAANTITAGQISAGAIGATELAANSVVAGKIAADSVTSNNIVARTIQAGDIAASTISATEIAANTITATQILAGTVTANEIAANTITAGQIAAGAITADRLAATLVLASTLIAGSQTGARVQLNGSGIQAFRPDGTTKTLDFSSATGNIIVAGQYRSGDSGARVIINTDGTQQFITNSGNQSLISNTSNGIQMRGPNDGSNNAGYVEFPDTTSASLKYGSTGGGTVYSRISADSGRTFMSGPNTDLYSNYLGNTIRMVNSDSNGGDISTSIMRYVQINRNGLRAMLSHPASNLAMVWGGGEVEFANQDGTGFRPIAASAFNVNSAAAAKDTPAEITLPAQRTSWDVVEGAPSMQWHYLDEQSRPDKPRHPDGTPVQVRRRRTDLPEAQLAALPETQQSELVDMAWDAPQPPASAHRFPLADDLAALDGAFVVGSGPGQTVDLRDMVGVLWDAVDMLIKRNRLVEARLTARVPALALPARPQKGDVAAGVGTIVAGRTRRDIDNATGQIRNRILTALGG